MRLFTPTDIPLDQLENIYRRYSEGEKPTALIKEFALPVSSSMFLSLFPPIDTGENCSRCGNRQVRKRANRAEIKAGTLPPAYCATCGHDETGGCRCQACIIEQAEVFRRLKEERDRQDQLKRDRINTNYRRQAAWTEAELATADLSALLCAATLIRSTNTNQLRYPAYLPLSYFKNAVRAELLSPSPDSPLEYFDDNGWLIDPLDAGISHYLNGTAPSSLDNLPAIMIGIMKEKVKTGGTAMREDIRNIWLDIAASECYEFLVSQVEYHRFQAKHLPTSTFGAIRRMLQQISAEKVNKVIYMSVRNMAAFSKTPACNHYRHAINSILHSLDENYHKQRTGVYSDKTFHRHHAHPRSIMSHIFFGDVLEGAGDIGFHTCVSDWLDQRWPQAKSSIAIPTCLDCGNNNIMYLQTSTYLEIGCPECGAGATYAIFDRQVCGEQVN